MAQTATDANRKAPRRHSPAAVVRELALSIAAVLGVLSILCAGAAVLLGVKPLIFMSGSMTPTIPTGSLALVAKTPIDKITVGDIVSYETTQGLRITHRVIKVQLAGGHKVLTLQGDANKTADVEPVTQSVVDREFFHIPGLGYALNAVMKPQWAFLGGGIVGVLVSLGFRRRYDTHLEQDAEREHDAEVDRDVDLADVEAAERLADGRDLDLTIWDEAAEPVQVALVPSAVEVVAAGYERRAALARERRVAEDETFNGIAMFSGLDTITTPDRTI